MMLIGFIYKLLLHPKIKANAALVGLLLALVLFKASPKFQKIV
jgi:hypothetical protein